MSRKRPIRLDIDDNAEQTPNKVHRRTCHEVAMQSGGIRERLEADDVNKEHCKNAAEQPSSLASMHRLKKLEVSCRLFRQQNVFCLSHGGPPLGTNISHLVDMLKATAQDVDMHAFNEKLVKLQAGRCAAGLRTPENCQASFKLDFDAARIPSYCCPFGCKKSVHDVASAMEQG